MNERTGTVRSGVPPLARTLERVGEMSDHLNVRLETPSGEGWFPASKFADKDSPHLDAFMQRVGGELGTRDRSVMASFFFGYYNWQIVAPVVICYLAEDRVPDTSASNLALHVNEGGRVDDLAILEEKFAALPDDPAAGHPGVTVVEDREALRRYFLDRFVGEHLPPVVESMRSRTPLGRRALWAAVADRCASTVIRVSGQLQKEYLRQSEVEAFVGEPPLKGGTGIVYVEHAGREGMFLKRGACCFNYKLTGENCATCPLLRSEERERRLKEHLARQG